MPIFALSFSNRSFVDRDGYKSILMGVGSYLALFNKVQILRMNEATGITKELEINEPWPQSKILWLPRQEDVGPEPGPDLLATSSDILRLYRL